MTDILDKLDIITKTPSKRTSEYYFQPSLDELIDRFATLSEVEKKQIDEDTIKKIKALQEGGIIK